MPRNTNDSTDLCYARVTGRTDRLPADNLVGGIEVEEKVMTQPAKPCSADADELAAMAGPADDLEALSDQAAGQPGGAFRPA